MTNYFFIISLGLVISIIFTVSSYLNLSSIDKNDSNSMIYNADTYTTTYINCERVDELHDAVLNDDFCDCIDGSDEPHTSACSNVLVGIKSFECSNGKKTFTSHINDGFSDCTNHDDEKNNNYLNVNNYLNPYHIDQMKDVPLPSGKFTYNNRHDNKYAYNNSRRRQHLRSSKIK